MDKLFSGHLSKEAQAVAVIMAGGSGTRFWPLSRTALPKQFLELTGTDDTLIRATAKRLEPLVGTEGTLVVTASHQKSLVGQQLPKAAVLSEPVARNTAPCIGLAAVCLLKTVGDVPMVCLPADHMVREEQKLVAILKQAVEIARSRPALVTIGIVPTAPETGYGYIERANVLPDGSFAVSRFVEKPDRRKAEDYLRSGNYFWNSGMFVWRPSVILAEIDRLLPELARGLKEIEKFWPADTIENFTKVSEIYRNLQAISIDFGIMERATEVCVIPGDGFDWSDVGSWGAWATLESPRVKEDGNFSRGDVVMVDSNGCFVLNKDDEASSKCIAGVGLNNLIIVQTKDAILICDREKTQDVKKIVDLLKEGNRKHLL